MNDSCASDAELVRLARSGKPEAFGELVVRYQDRLYNSVYHMAGNERDAEDIAQDVFLRAYEGLRGFRQEAKFSTWLFGIMLNTVRNFWRRQGRRPAALSLDATAQDGQSSFSDPPSPHDGPQETNVREERVARVRAAIDELDEESREILVLRDIEGFSYTELAEVLELPLGTVKSRLYRARAGLKKKLEPMFEGGEL